MKLEKILDLMKKKTFRGMYKMANFPITFGDFFFVAVVCRMIMGPLQKKKCEKNASSRLLSLQNESHS